MNHVCSKHRAQSPTDALKIFEKLLKGTDKDAMTWCMRAKMDMDSNNGCMRDPVLYRGNVAHPHHRTGTKFKAYPTYDFACPIVDSIEGVTHCLRSTEFNDRNPQYHTLQDMLQLRQVRIWEYGKLNFVNTVLSKRKLQWFVDNGTIPGWDDPRFPTIQGAVRRGVTMAALRKFIYAQGASRNIVLQEWDRFWSSNKDEFEPTASRFFGVAAQNAVRLTVATDEFDLVDGANKVAAKTVAKVPANESLGMRPMRLAHEVLLESEDAATCAAGDMVILLWWGVCEVTSVTKDPVSGRVTSMAATRLPLVKPSSKMKKKFNWVANVSDNATATVLEFDHLITKPKIEEDEAFQDFVNPLSRGEMAVVVEPEMKQLPVGAIVQLVRRGFFRVDHKFNPQDPNGSLHLVLIPDGKAKSMSTLSTALPHH